MNKKYPTHVSALTKYIWRCGDRYATISMEPDEMDRMAETESANLMGDIHQFIGNHGGQGHEFVKIKDEDAEIVFVCEKWDYKKRQPLLKGGQDERKAFRDA